MDENVYVPGVGVCEKTERGALICPHGRQLTLCGQCIQSAERNHVKDTPDDSHIRSHQG